MTIGEHDTTTVRKKMNWPVRGIICCWPIAVLERK